MRTHYDNLHVSESASPEVIRAAYKVLAQKWHPDKNPDQGEKAERYFKIITQAFDVLSDPGARSEYDKWLAAHRNAKSQQPEAVPGKDQPQQSHQASMAEAREDGKRSREQGFSEKDCPYSGDLAGAWRQGFNACGQKPAQAGAATTKGSRFGRLWRGEEGLGKTFWLYGVVGMVAVIGAAFVFSIAVANNRGDMPPIIRLAQNFYGAYFIFIAVCIWRSAGHSRPMSAWAISARAFCLTPIYGVVLAILIPGISSQSKPVASYTPSSPPQAAIAPQADRSLENGPWLDSVRQAEQQVASGVLPVVEGAYMQELPENSGLWPSDATDAIESKSIWWAYESNGFRVKTSNTSAYSMKTIRFEFEATACKASRSPRSFYITLNRSVESGESVLISFPNGGQGLSGEASNCLVIDDIWDQGSELSQEDVHFQKIYAAHPDTDSVVESVSFKAWVSGHHDRERVVKEGTTYEIIVLLSEYKSYKQSPQPAQSPQRDTYNPAPQTPNCQIKQTMTDADYRACGITPPGSAAG